MTHTSVVRARIDERTKKQAAAASMREIQYTIRFKRDYRRAIGGCRYPGGIASVVRVIST